MIIVMRNFTHDTLTRVLSRKSFLNLKVKIFQQVPKSSICPLRLIYFKDSTPLHTSPPYQEQDQKLLGREALRWTLTNETPMFLNAP